MATTNRCMFSLILALSLTTLASANSTDITAVYTHTTNSVSSHAVTSTHLSPKGTSAVSGSLHNNFSASQNGNVASGSVTGSLSGVGHFGGDLKRNVPLGPTHGTISYKTGNWAASQPNGGGLSAPEPSTLMLLSTGLLGIAGAVRRKLSLA